MTVAVGVASARAVAVGVASAGAVAAVAVALGGALTLGVGEGSAAVAAPAGRDAGVEVLGGGSTIAARCASTSTAGPIRRRPRGTETAAAASPPPANCRKRLRPRRFSCGSGGAAAADGPAWVAALSSKRSVAAPAIPAASAVVQACAGEVNGSRAPTSPPTRAKTAKAATPIAR